GPARGRADGYDLVVVAMDEQQWNVDLLQILGKVGLRERADAVERRLEPGLHALQPELVQQPLWHLRAGAVGAVEGDGEVAIVLRAVAADAGANGIERRDGQSARIVARL